MDPADLEQVRRRFLDSVFDPDAPHSRTHVPYDLLDAMARQARRLPVPPLPSIDDDVAEIVAALTGTTHPLLRAIRDRLARHVRRPR